MDSSCAGRAPRRRRNRGIIDVVYTGFVTRQSTEPLAPESLVARIIAELQANPAAQQLLLRAMLTNEFLGMPARLDAVQEDVAKLQGEVAELRVDVAQLRHDVAQLQRDVAQLQRDVAQLQREVAQIKLDVAGLREDLAKLTCRVTVLEHDVAALKGDSLEVKLHRRIRPCLSQKLRLRRARTLHGDLIDTDRDMRESLYAAVDENRITEEQEARVFATDLIVRAERRDDRTPVWVAIEASNTLDARDVERARESADALRTVFGARSVAAVMGYAIPDDVRRLADTRGAEVFVIDENH